MTPRAVFVAEVEKQLKEGAGAAGERGVQLRRRTNRRGKQAPTPPKRTRYATYIQLVDFTITGLCYFRKRHI